MLNISVNTDEFSRVFKEYMKYSKESFADACNRHAFFIAKAATNTTKGADKERIKAQLENMSRTYPGVPLAAILVNRERGKRGKKGLNGQKMANAVEKYIRKIQSHVNFLRSGWLPAIKKLGPLVKGKGSGFRVPGGTDKKGRDFGGAIKATTNTFSPVAWIWSSIVGKGNRSPIVQKIIEEGAQKAMAAETISMRDYIERKQTELCKRMWG